MNWVVFGVLTGLIVFNLLGVGIWHYEYAMYGLPLFKATAVKYGWDNPIGEDTGTEEYYAEEDW